METPEEESSADADEERNTILGEYVLYNIAIANVLLLSSFVTCPHHS